MFAWRFWLCWLLIDLCCAQWRSTIGFASCESTNSKFEMAPLASRKRTHRGRCMTIRTNLPRGWGLMAILCIEILLATATLIVDFTITYDDGWQSMSRFMAAFLLTVVLVTTSFICLVFGVVERAMSRRKAEAPLGMLNLACILHATLMASSVVAMTLWSG